MKMSSIVKVLGVTTCCLLLVAAFVVSQHLEHDELEDESEAQVVDASNPQEVEVKELQKLKGKPLMEKLRKSGAFACLKTPVFFGWHDGHCFDCCLSNGYTKWISLPFSCHCYGRYDQEVSDRHARLQAIYKLRDEHYEKLDRMAQEEAEAKLRSE